MKQKLIKPLVVVVSLLAMPLAMAEINTTLDFRPLAGSEQHRSEDVLALPGQPGTWLVASALNGLRQVDEKGQWQPLYGGNVEALDSRGPVTVGDVVGTLVSAIDQESGEVLLALLEDNEVRELARLTSDTALPEAQCLYQDPGEGHVSLFTVDARGMVQQRIVIDAQRQALVNIPVRQFVGVPDAEACVVDDIQQALYVAEETLGVWRYDATAESDPSRQPVALVAPHGQLPGEVADLAIADSGELWVLTGTPAAVQRYDRQGVGTRMTLPDMDAAKTFAVARDKERLLLAVYDEDQDNVQLADMNTPIHVSEQADKMIVDRVIPSVQTDPVSRFGDAADDPAIWVDSRRPERSLVIGTDKKEGLKVYGLDGVLRQALDIGRLNNVDLITDTDVAGKSRPLIAASNRTTNGIALFTLDGQRRVQSIGEVATDLDEVYGLCMYQSATGDYVFVNDSDGRYRQYRINAAGKVPAGELVRQFNLPSQPEGCVADSEARQLYMGEERAGIWRTSAEPGDDALELVLSVDDRLVADVEGLDIYYAGDQRYLVVSSQGNDSYLVYGLQSGYPQLAHFRVAANLAQGIDGASETDGLAVTASALPGFPRGVLVVQDGRNRMPEQPQNFKLVDWQQVQTLIDNNNSE